MTRNTTSTREKGRAVFLAALMVLSVFAMGAAFAGSAVADHSDNEKDISDGDFAYQGETIVISGITSVTDSDTVDLYSGVPGGDDVSWEREVDVDTQNDTVTLDTSDLGQGDWFIEEDNGNTTAFEIRVQNLDGTMFSADQVTQSGSVDLEVDSNRGGFLAEISSGSFTQDQLTSMLNDYNQSATSAHDDIVVVDARATYTLDFSQVDVSTGSYNFSVEAADTTASSELTLDVVSDDEAQVSFGNENNVATGPVGDSNTILVDMQNTDEAYVELTWTPENSEEVITLLNGTVTANENADQVELDVNTVLLARGDANVVSATNGSFNADHLGTWDRETQLEVYNEWTKSFNMNLYDANGDRQDRGTFRVTDSGIDEVNTYVVSSDDTDTLDELGVAADGTVAAGDYVAVEIVGSGIFGLLEEDPANYEAFNISVVQTNPPFGEDPKDITPAVGDMTISEDENRVVAFMPTGGNNDAQANEQYKATVKTVASADAEDEGMDPNPYIDSTDTFESSFTVEEPTLSFDQDSYSVTADSGQEITGTSNVAPGASIFVQAETPDGSDNPFYIPTYTEVGEDGTWTATMDFSGQVQDTEFSLSAELEDNGDVSDTADGVVGEPSPEPYLSVTNVDVPEEVMVDEDASIEATITNTADSGPAEGTVTLTIGGEEVASEEVSLEAGGTTTLSGDFDTSAEGDIEWAVETPNESESGTLTVSAGDDGGSEDGGSEDGGSEDGGSEDGGSEDGGSEDGGSEDGGDGGDDGTPGFGVAVALVALLGAAMLALRRQD
ncbi:BGTF surface domain-containing protein [Halovivax limisalsi]|uniref:BGTF surface domain-containing protein n=1 Tax=Halovivax limisalsi TaxID=1453760 RepID=UPI001FFC2C10|nr:BGTF surface domain-containing protein [Halovivax limisalsi]